MKVWASPAARALTGEQGGSLRALANWAYAQRRFRDPAPHEARLWPIGPNATVVLDEGRLLVRHGDTITIYAMEELT